MGGGEKTRAARKQKKSPGFHRGSSVVRMKPKGLVDHNHHVRQLGDRAANFRGVLTRHDLVHLVEAKADEDLLLALRTADRRTDLLDRDSLNGSLCHLVYSVIASAAASASATFAPPRPSRSATFLPRR